MIIPHPCRGRGVLFDTLGALWHHKQSIGAEWLRNFAAELRGIVLPPSGTLLCALRRKRQILVSADDDQLIAECLRGNRAAFEVLVRRYEDRLFNTVFRLV